MAAGDESESEGLTSLSPPRRRNPSAEGRSLTSLSPDLRALAEASTDLFGYCSAVRDETGDLVRFRLEYVNAAALAANGGTCEGQAGRCLFELLLARRENGLFERCREVVETGRPYALDRLPVDDVGTDRPVRLWFDVRLAKLGDGFLATGRDVTAAHLREEEQARLFEQTVAALRESEHLLAAKSKVEEASRTKDRLLAVLSHELRSPLSPILLAASALAGDRRLPVDARRRAAMIEHNATVEARLIDDLLDLTRVEHGKLALDRRPVALRQVLDEAIQTCAGELAAKRLALEVNLAGAGAAVLDADALRLTQASWNLLANAIKFTPPGGTVRLSAREEEGWVVVEIADSGIGIEASWLPRVFDAFEQGPPQSPRRHGGLGLGLTIAKAMVEAHGGSLTVASDGPGRGATFRMRLPKAAAP
jgi:signal transduction histidine kinase